MANIITVRRSATPAAVPTTSALALGELAINTNDGKLFLKKSVAGVETIVDVTASGGGVATFSAGTTGFTPAVATSGAVVLAGTLAIANGGTGNVTGTATINANSTGAITSVGNATSLGSFTSANLATALTDETGTGAAVFGTNPTLTGATLAGTVAGAGNQINNVIIGASSPLAGSFTTLSATGVTTLTAGLAGTSASLEVRTGGAIMVRPPGNDFDYQIKSTGVGGAAILGLFAGTDATTPKFSLDSYGNVGIGTSSPNFKLDVNGTFIARANSNFYQPTANTSLVLTYETTNGSSVRTTQTQLSTGGFVWNNDVGGNGGSDYYAWQVSSSERMRLDSSGNLLVGATATSYGMKLRVNGGIASTGSVQFNIDGTAGTNFEFVLRLGAGMQFYVNNATVIGTLTASGVWTNASDARYKENIRPMTYGLAEVMQLQPRAYNIIGSEKQEIGFVAQEVEPFIPELVESSRNSVTGEDRLTLSYGQMSAVLVKAIQELKAIIDTQATRITALEAK